MGCISRRYSAVPSAAAPAEIETRPAKAIVKSRRITHRMIAFRKQRNSSSVTKTSDKYSSGGQSAQGFEAHSRTVVRPFPFTHLGKSRIGFAIRVNAPEPFTMHTVRELILDVVPRSPRCPHKIWIAG